MKYLKRVSTITHLAFTALFIVSICHLVQFRKWGLFAETSFFYAFIIIFVNYQIEKRVKRHI